MMRDIRTNDNYSSGDPVDSERFDLGLEAEDRDAKLAEEMFERFLHPQWNKYMFADCGNTGTSFRHYCYESENLHPEMLTAELKQKAIALIIETLEAAEAVLMAKLNAIILEQPTITE